MQSGPMPCLLFVGWLGACVTACSPPDSNRQLLDPPPTMDASSGGSSDTFSAPKTDSRITSDVARTDTTAVSTTDATTVSTTDTHQPDGSSAQTDVAPGDGPVADAAPSADQTTR